MKAVLERILDGHELDPEVMEDCFASLMGGEWSEPQQAAFLVALRARGESAGEVAAAARILRRMAIPVEVSRAPVVDTCGTGGDASHTVNISTAAAFVVAACGVAVAKHGNRSVSSRCGSADVVEALGLPLDLAPEACSRLLEEEGFAFLFAPRLHPAMRAVMPVRRALGVRTVFNLLGPLCNPAAVRRQVVGVYAEEVMPLVAGALAALGAEHAWVVHGSDGLDEVSVCAPTRVIEVRDGEIGREFTLEPQAFGIRRARLDDLRGGDAAANAARIRTVLSGEDDSPVAEAVLLNAAAALTVSGRLGFGEALDAARECLRTGEPAARLDAVVDRARRLAT